MSEIECPKCKTKFTGEPEWDKLEEQWEMPRCPVCNQAVCILMTPKEIKDLKAATPKKKTSKKARAEEAFRKKADEMLYGKKNEG